MLPFHDTKDGPEIQLTISKFVPLVGSAASMKDYSKTKKAHGQALGRYLV